jgi:hypothetical protein
MDRTDIKKPIPMFRRTDEVQQGLKDVLDGSQAFVLSGAPS